MSEFWLNIFFVLQTRSYNPMQTGEKNKAEQVCVPFSRDARLANQHVAMTKVMNEKDGCFCAFQSWNYLTVGINQQSQRVSARWFFFYRQLEPLWLKSTRRTTTEWMMHLNDAHFFCSGLFACHSWLLRHRLLHTRKKCTPNIYI